jgi:hypothetical protein
LCWWFLGYEIKTRFFLKKKKATKLIVAFP